MFLATFLYAVGFVGNMYVPKSIDSVIPGTHDNALLINMLLLSVFAIQHSVMARPAFKRWWTKFIPNAIERSTYVLLSNLALILLYWKWQPMNGVIWNIESTITGNIMWGLFWLGWVIVLISTFLINHFELFGLQQVYMNIKGEKIFTPTFKTPFLYKLVRHPIMLGFIIAFWATPHMTVGHMLFAAASTGYILIALQLEECDLVTYFGDRHIDYRRRVSMIIPIPKKM